MNLSLDAEGTSDKDIIQPPEFLWAPQSWNPTSLKAAEAFSATAVLPKAEPLCSSHVVPLKR